MAFKRVTIRRVGPLSWLLAVIGSFYQMNTWNFISTIGEERSDALLKAPSLNTILELIEHEMEILCCHRPPCCEMDGFSRVVFNLRVSQKTFDLFFNSENGYRGAYFNSPHTGLEANETSIRHLSPLLISWAEKHEPSLDKVFAKESLSSPTAKIWLTEFESHLCPKCEGEWGNPTDETSEILNGRWELDSSPNACRGRKAPFLSKIRVFGAFLNERYDEFTPARKRFRANQINKSGWS